MLSLQTTAHSNELEQAIVDSHPQKLEKLLTETTLNVQQKKTYLQLAAEIYQMRRSKAVWGENPLQGEPYAIGGLATFIGGTFMAFPYMIEYVNPSFKRTRNYAEPFNYRYATINASLFLASFILCCLAYKENQKPGWRSRKDEYLDAFKVVQLLGNLPD